MCGTSYVIRRVAGIWADVIGIDRVGATEELTELGGNSLVAVQVLARLQEAFELDLPPRLLLGRPTVASVAAGIAEHLLARRPRRASSPLRGEEAARESTSSRSVMPRWAAISLLRSPRATDSNTSCSRCVNTTGSQGKTK
jgi:acyl carrier protein